MSTVGDDVKKVFLQRVTALLHDEGGKMSGNTPTCHLMFLLS